VAILAHHFVGMNASEISEMLGMSKSSVTAAIGERLADDIKWLEETPALVAMPFLFAQVREREAESAAA
jgi:hypothetical protein